MLPSNTRTTDSNTVLDDRSGASNSLLESIKNSLNPEQYKAVISDETLPVCVYSGPGSGKTKTITYRIAYLTVIKKIHPSNIYAMTFTNKAANEMKSRVYQLISQFDSGKVIEEGDYCHLGTFHAICAKILRRHANKVRSNLTTSFTILDSQDQQAIVNSILKESDNSIISEFVSGRKHNLQKVLSAATIIHDISGAKNRQLSASQFAQEVKELYRSKQGSRNYLNSYRNNTNDPNKIKEVIAQVYIEYERYLQENNMLDFDDLLVNVCTLFHKCPEILRQYSEHCKALLVDEFQDTNSLQYKIAKALSSKYKNIFVVGDVDQNIYTWRFSDCSLMKKLLNEFPNMKTVLLNQNYRSTKNILKVSDEIIAQNTDRIREENLFTFNNTGIPVSIHSVDSSEAEANFVASEILKLINTSNGKLSFRDFCVLIRINASSRSFENAFALKGIKYRVLGCFKFYDRMEVKDIISYARIVDNVNDDMAFERCINIPKRGIGESSLASLKKAAKAQNLSCYETIRLVCKEKKKISGVQAKKGFKEFIDLIDSIKAKQETSPKNILNAIVKGINYKSYLEEYEQSTAQTRFENVMELLNISAEFEMKDKDANLTSFLHNISLIPDNFNEGETDSNDQVTLSTIHSAKGLEYGIVFVCGLEEGGIPFYRAESKAEIEEERRLLFVACTRAQSCLSLTYSSYRLRGGENAHCEVSRFLEPIIEIANKAKSPHIAFEKPSTLINKHKSEWQASLEFEVSRRTQQVAHPSTQIPQQQQQQMKKTPSSPMEKQGSSQHNAICLDSSSDEDNDQLVATKKRSFRPTSGKVSRGMDTKKTKLH
ncbi:hypothetical protein C9374_014022 [Naegleria lovaniensis]|uniref:DNA 3'-5' helicase n=1 Tax=Naegleria lovaniensis TaxID=51637 RepID=A0AA88GYK4_NAELO|nr:uncharacterized protein C9374_014022 [Naegleria lovaniensis]KAG2389462.1 hypothetical protein C9374_014022 [Naegleria lovaniensis]